MVVQNTMPSGVWSEGASAGEAPLMASGVAAGVGGSPMQRQAETTDLPQFHRVIANTPTNMVGEAGVGSVPPMSEGALMACRQLYVLRNNGQITDAQYHGMVNNIRQNDLQQQSGRPPALRQNSGFITGAAPGTGPSVYGQSMATMAAARAAHGAQTSRVLPSLADSKTVLTEYYAKKKPDSGKDFSFKSLQDLANSKPSTGPDGPTPLEVDAAKRFVASPNTMHALDGGNEDQVFSQKNLEHLTIDPVEAGSEAFVDSNGAVVTASRLKGAALQTEAAFVGARAPSNSSWHEEIGVGTAAPIEGEAQFPATTVPPDTAKSMSLPSIADAQGELIGYYAKQSPDSGKDFSFASLDKLASSTASTGPEGPTQAQINAAKRFKLSPTAMESLDGGVKDHVFSMKNLHGFISDPAAADQGAITISSAPVNA
jgi:hypothetical protein